MCGLHLTEVSSEAQTQLWNELMIREHPLHPCRLVGRRLRYLVGSEHGWLGAIGFGSAALYLEDRDEWIGWTAAQRMEHLPRVLPMNRFLIRPCVRCENLASLVLSLCAGLGSIGTHQTGAQSRGLDLHSSLAVGDSGLALGVLRLHGYLHRKGDGPPGFESRWRGYARFHDMVMIMKLRKADDAHRR